MLIGTCVYSRNSAISGSNSQASEKFVESLNGA